MKKSVSLIPYLTISSNIGSDTKLTNWDLPPVSSVIYSELINFSVSKEILNGIHKIHTQIPDPAC